jgi:ketol-acid reductoisomerase
MYEMRKAISNTAKYGSAISGPEVVDSRTRASLDKVLSRIESGEFAKLFNNEYEGGRKDGKRRQDLTSL